jgi:hypothetical protein
MLRRQQPLLTTLPKAVYCQHHDAESPSIKFSSQQLPGHGAWPTICNASQLLSALLVFARLMKHDSVRSVLNARDL